MFPILNAALVLPTPGHWFLFEGLDCTTPIPLDSHLRGNNGSVAGMTGRVVHQVLSQLPNRACAKSALTQSPFVVSLSNHERTALRQAQGERESEE